MLQWIYKILSFIFIWILYIIRIPGSCGLYLPSTSVMFCGPYRSHSLCPPGRLLYYETTLKCNQNIIKTSNYWFSDVSWPEIMNVVFLLYIWFWPVKYSICILRYLWINIWLIESQSTSWCTFKIQCWRATEMFFYLRLVCQSSGLALNLSTVIKSTWQFQKCYNNHYFN